MTAKRNLKRRVRERQARTGESYMTALRQVRSRVAGGQVGDGQVGDGQVGDDSGSAIETIEMIDVTDIAAALGFRCTAMLSPTLADRIDVATVLRQLRDALTATEHDPAFAALRAGLIRGEHPVLRPPSIVATRRFMVRARAGIGGISEHGTILALATRGRQGMEMVLFLLRLRPVKYSDRPPMLFVSSLDGVHVAGSLALALR